MDTLKALARSRKFWIAVLSVGGIAAVQYAGLSKDLWIAIRDLAMLVIAAIAVEDAAKKYKE